MENNTDTSSKRSKKKRFSYKKLLLFFIIVWIVMLMGIGLGFLTASINPQTTITQIRPPASSQIYDINGKLIANIHSVENRLPVTLSKIPKNLQNAFVAVEDARFYQHSGIDPRGILRAVWSNITSKGVAEGGSTITQQLAKNAYLSQERTLKRKIQEAFLALQLERQYTKNEILEFYLNQIYFGQGAYGVQAAAQVYFDKNVEDLDLAECAMLAGIPKSPNYFSPLNNFKAANERKAVVLDQMTKYGYIDNSTASKSKSEEIKLAKHTKQDASFASYFIDYVTQQLVEKYGADAVYKEGLKIYTTLDADMQTAAESAMKLLPTYRTDENGIVQPQGALVSIEPSTGHIKALVGGRGTDQFNRAILAERQPGSAFKPFVFLAALESNLSPGTIIDDSPITIGGWSPQNYSRNFNGKVTLRQTAERSLNVPTVKIAQLIGVDKVLYYAQQLGISTLVFDGSHNDRNLSTALGGLTRGVTPLDLSSAYSAFANNGVHIKPLSILKVIDRNGKVLEQAAPEEKSVVSAKSAYVLTDILKGVMTRGTGAGSNIGRPSAGKSGTTSDYKDAWFVGYTPDLSTAVWMGNDNNTSLGVVTGSDTPADIWKAFMTKALASKRARDFTRPPGAVIDDTPVLMDKDAEKDAKDTKDEKDAKDAKTKEADAAKKAASTPVKKKKSADETPKEAPVRPVPPISPEADNAASEKNDAPPIVPPPAPPSNPAIPPAPDRTKE